MESGTIKYMRYNVRRVRVVRQMPTVKRVYVFMMTIKYIKICIKYRANASELNPELNPVVLFASHV